MRLGSLVRISEHNDNEGYSDWRERKLKIIHVAKNRSEHPGYDEGVGGLLFDLRDAKTGEVCPFSLYEYELEEA